MSHVAILSMLTLLLDDNLPPCHGMAVQHTTPADALSLSVEKTMDGAGGSQRVLAARELDRGAAAYSRRHLVAPAALVHQHVLITIWQISLRCRCHPSAAIVCATRRHF